MNSSIGIYVIAVPIKTILIVIIIGVTLFFESVETKRQQREIVSITRFETKNANANLWITSLPDKKAIPSRIVTGFICKKNSNILPLECSLGIVHEKRPPKSFHWAVVSKKFKSQI